MRAGLLALLAVATVVTATAPGAQVGVSTDAGGTLLTIPHMEMPEKQLFPEVVGRPCAEAKAAIEAQFPNLRVFIVPEGAMVTMDFQTDRVRIYCSAAGTVASPPRIG